MQTILIINGAEIRDRSGGKFNSSLAKKAQEILEAKFTILKSESAHSYNIQEEQNKFLQADAVIFQYPVYWFSLPSTLKKYIDDIYQPKIFFGHSEKYGYGGLLTGKKYMLSTTWNSPEDTFNNPDGFMEGKSVDELLFFMHKTQQYCGMEPLKSFSAHNIVKNTRYEFHQQRYVQHLQEVFG